MRVGREITPDQIAGPSGHAVQPFQAGLLHPARRSAIVATEKIEAPAAGDHPARPDAVTVADTKYLFSWLAHPDPHNIGTAFIDRRTNSCLFILTEKPMPAARDLEAGVQAFQALSGRLIDLFGCT